MEIEVGEYIRTETGYIGKVIEILSGAVAPRVQTERKAVSTMMIIKHSKNIIDIIEVGDYVNGYRVSEKDEKYIETDTSNCDCVEGMSWLIENTEIESIVTKEQMKEMEYRVDEV